MIRLRLSDQDVSATRIAPSPLWETVGALLLLRESRVPWPYAPWADRARQVLPTLDVAALAPLLGQQPCVPDAFIPAPRAETSIEEELEQIVSAPPETTRSQIAYELPNGVPPDLLPFVEAPRRAAARFAAALHAFWEAALAPDWPAMQALLERDLLGRARQVARHGSEAVFADLHERIRWQRSVLEIEKRWELDLAPAGHGLVLVPLVFSRAALLVSLPDGGRFAVSYPARGVATLWGEVEQTDDERLEVLLGSGRATVLRHLDEPRTTLELAECLCAAPSTVSHHLGVLDAGGLLVRRRVGRRVYYELNGTGRSLLSLFGSAPSARDLRGFASDRMH